MKYDGVKHLELTIYYVFVGKQYLKAINDEGGNLMNDVYSIDEIKAKLFPVFDSYPIVRAVLFGSYAKGKQTPKSDIDILIDSNGKIRGIDFFGVREDMTEALNVHIDLIEASQIIHGGRVQREIAETGVVIYERA